MDNSVLLLIVSALVILMIGFFFMGLQIVPDGNARIVERLGRRHRTLLPGVSLIIPIIDRVRKTQLGLETIMDNGTRRVPLVDASGNVSMAEQRMDPREMKLMGRDNAEIFVDAVAYFRITEPMRAAYDVVALADTFMSLIETTLRQEVGKLDGDSIVTSRDFLSENLRTVLQEASVTWGLEVIRVEIENIRFDEEIMQKLSEARRQELIRRAEIVAAQAAADREVLEAEASKKAMILRAEGEKAAQIALATAEKEAQILKAQGQFEEQRLEAEARFLLQSREQEGQAQGYSALVTALAEKSEAIIALEALKAQVKVAESIGNSSNALILPAETAGLFGALNSVAKGLEMARKI